VKTYILTRGVARHLDYGYLGPVPREWWQVLREWTTTDRPASLACGTGDELSLLLAGIPSVRRDAIGRPIRFTLVLEAGEADSEQCGKLVRASLSELGREGIGTALDEALPSKEIDDLLASRVTAADLDRRVQDALAKALTGQEPATAATACAAAAVGSWAGSLGDSDAENAFVARVRALACGQPGYAATLNLVQSIERATAIAGELRQSAALLLPERLVQGVRPLEGKEPTGSRESLLDQLLTLGGRSDRTTMRRLIMIGAVILSAGALTLLIRWLIGRG
jgi:hypothetical protein